MYLQAHGHTLYPPLTVAVRLAERLTGLAPCPPRLHLSAGMPGNARLTKADYELLAEFRWSVRHFLRFSESAARVAGITPQQHQALLAIKGFPGRERVLVGELAERLQLLHHSTVGLADRLVALGFVRRFPDSADRRRVYLELTTKGEATLEQLSAAHREQLRRLGPRLTRLLKELSEHLHRPGGKRGSPKRASRP
jgi:DNA-binding MarR family transcriptional regulator